MVFGENKYIISLMRLVVFMEYNYIKDTFIYWTDILRLQTTICGVKIYLQKKS